MSLVTEKDATGDSGLARIRAGPLLDFPGKRNSVFSHVNLIESLKICNQQSSDHSKMRDNGRVIEVLLCTLVVTLAHLVSSTSVKMYFAIQGFRFWICISIEWSLKMKPKAHSGYRS